MTDLITDSSWVAVWRKPDGSVKVTIKWPLTRWLLLAGFIPGLIVGFALGAVS